MRISSKRLRYALELFAQCYGDALKEIAEEVSELQGSLGNLHDCDVWVEAFGDYLREDEEAAGDHSAARSPQRRAAVVWLLGHFAEKRMRHYREALDRWHEWQRTDFAGQIEEALGGRR